MAPAVLVLIYGFGTIKCVNIRDQNSVAVLVLYARTIQEREGQSYNFYITVPGSDTDLSVIRSVTDRCDDN